MIQINIDTSIYNLTKQYPIIKEIMYELGFEDILKPGLLQSVGRLMTIKKGCSMKNIELEHVEKVFMANGFKINDNQVS